ncbi:MAG: FAD-linked oxidase C-terminal domain-containing protein [Phycisphaerae bacterium]|nr:FAD-linked oxidase C-terminal domain-containing protein [Phycisphaerae bacterium]
MVNASVRTVPLTVLPSPAKRDEAAIARIAADLTALGLRDVRFGRQERMLYATEASIYQVEPLGVVVLDRPEDAVVVMQYCATHGIPILPRGGGTSLNGQTVNVAVVLDFSAHCRGIVAVDLERRRCRVEPGVVLDQLNDALKPSGLMFAPDPNTGGHNNIGGMIGNNSAGAHSILYGRCVEHVLGLDVVLADGTPHRLEEGACEREPVQRELARRMAEIVLPLRDQIRARFPKIVRHVDGYNLDLFLDQLEASTPGTFDRVNLASFVCGSEGTLATVTQAELRCVDAPTRTGLAIVGFDSVDTSLDALDTMLSTIPAAVELVDDTIVGLARENTEYATYVSLMPQPTSGRPLGAVMYVEYFGHGPGDIEAHFAQLRAKLPAAPIQFHLDPVSMKKAWTLRRACEPLLHGIPGLRKPIGFVEDTAVAPGRLPGFIREFKEVLTRHGTFAAFFAHASVGCLHIRPMLSLKSAQDRELMMRIAEEITDLVVKYGGALSGEHGTGRSRSHLAERYFGKDLCDAMRTIQAIWDPQGRMNPGNKVAWTDPQTMITNLRVKPADRVVTADGIDTYFRYDREHGFGHAVEACNGAGLCRRLQAGTMCPSYQVLLDERHATRGRGNHLRLAITGQFSEDGTKPSWHDPSVHETLRLCLSCKACKAECPTNVDIAKLKAEYTAQHYRTHGVSRQARAFGAIRFINALGSMLHPVANAMLGIGLVRYVQERILGIDRRRSMPLFGPSALRWHAQRTPQRTPQLWHARPVVLLFADCFATYNEPHVARAAIETLEAFGYRVAMPDVGCCGRAQISMGDLGRAAITCAATARALIAAVQQESAVAVLALEPSCLSAIKDDWQDLKMDLDVADVRQLRDMSFLVEEFLDRRWDEHPVRPVFHWPSDAALTLHGHCHQKALWGTESSAALLRRIAGPQLDVLASGCCGMAGSFGFTTDRYDLSMAIGERNVFPAVRANPAATLCAPGTSCRHQILDGTGRHAKHPMELVRAAIVHSEKL